jgi:hypothetical protein
LEKEVKVKIIGNYNGHSFKSNKSVDLGLIFEYGELLNYIKLVQMINENIDVQAKIGDTKVRKLGLFMFKSLTISHDGEGSLKLNSQLDYVESTMIDALVGEERVGLLFKASIQVDDEEAED